MTPHTLTWTALAAIVLVLATWTNTTPLSLPPDWLITWCCACGSDGCSWRHRLLRLLLVQMLCCILVLVMRVMADRSNQVGEICLLGLKLNLLLVLKEMMVLVVHAIWRRHKVNSLLEMLLVRRGIELLLMLLLLAGCMIQVYTLDLHCSSMVMMLWLVLLLLMMLIICDNLTIFFLIVIVDEIGRL